MPPISNFQKSCIAIAVSQAAMPFLSSSQVSAATITVNANCTLYEAIDTANGTVVGSTVGCSNGDAGADLIDLPSNETINLNTVGGPGLLVNSEVTIRGNGSTILGGTGTAAKRLIDVTAGADLALFDVILSGGNVSGGEGGAIRVRDANLTINSSTLRNNTVSNGSGGAILASGSDVEINDSYLGRNRSSAGPSYQGRGGAIHLRPGSSLTVARTLFRRNVADRGGVIDALNSLEIQISESSLERNTANKYGGAISSGVAGNVTISNSELNFNRAGTSGGAIDLRAGSLILSDSSLRSNSAINNGGAIRVTQDAGLTVQGALFSQNGVGPDSTPEAPLPTKYQGGAISFDIGEGIPLDRTIISTTFSSNFARFGGAIDLQSGALTMANSTIVVAGRYLGYRNSELPNEAGDAVVIGGGAQLNLANTVMSGNPLAKLSEFGSTEPTSHCSFDIGGGLSSNTNNHFQDDSCDGTASGKADLSPLVNIADNPRVSVGSSGYSRNLSLQDPRYHVPNFNSPLLDSGDPTVCAGGLVAGVDQRGVPHASPQCDIGAIDSRETVITVDNTGDRVASGLAVCTLRDALISASPQGGEFASEPRVGSTCADSYAQTTIRFAPSLFVDGSATISLLPASSGSSYLSGVSRSVRVQGPGQSSLSIDGGGQSAIFYVGSAYLNVSNMTISGGSASFSGGAVRAYNSQLILSRVSLNDHQVGGEGGAINARNSVATISNSTVSSNTSGGAGGAISLIGKSSMILNSSTVSDNSASTNGGGVRLKYGSVAKVTNSTLSGNSAEQYGGGLYLKGSSAIIYNSTIASNTAAFGSGIIALETNDEEIPKPSDGILKTDPNVGILGDPVPSGNNSFVHIFNSIVSGNVAPPTVWPSGLEVNFQSGTNAVFYGSLLGASENDFFAAINTGGDPLNLQNSSILATSALQDGMPNPNSTAFASILEPLANNGGPTLTHNLARNSPAIDSAGFQAMCLAFDQRGFRRDNRCDIGAVEIQGESFFIIKAANGNVISFSL